MAEIEDRVSKLEKTLARLAGGAIVAGIALLVFFGVEHYLQIPRSVTRAFQTYIENHPRIPQQLQEFLSSAKMAAKETTKYAGDAKQTVDQLEALLGRFREDNLSPSYSMWMSEHNTDGYTVEEIPLEIFKELCADLDGCLIQLKMKKWNDRDGSLHIALSKWASVIYDSDTGAWTSQPVFYKRGCTYDCIYGRDAFTDNVETREKKRRDRNHLLQEFYAGRASAACYLTDREYSPHDNDTDSRKGIHLLSATASYNVSDRRCGITIRD